MKMTRIIIIVAVVLVLVAAIAVAVACFFKSRSKPSENDTAKAHRVYCDEKFFQADSKDFMFEAGSTVRLVFRTPVEGVNYTFSAIGVEHFDTSRDSENGYVIQFEMPKKYVSVNYRVEEPFEGINISMDENPSTGFQWQYEVSPKRLLVLVEDIYKSDPYYGDEPIDGQGGKHYWKFKVVGKGTVKIKFCLRRGDEEIDEITYKYACDGTSATLIE